MGLHEELTAIDDVTQALGGVGGKVILIGTFGKGIPTLRLSQQRLAVADLRLHLIHIDGVAVRMFLGCLEHRILQRHPRHSLGIIACMDIRHRDGGDGLLTLSIVERIMISCQTFTDAPQGPLVTGGSLLRLSEVQLAVADGTGNIGAVYEGGMSCLTQFPIHSIRFAEGGIIAFHVAKQAHVIIIGIDITLEIARIGDALHVDVSQEIIELEGAAELALHVICHRTIEDTFGQSEFASLLDTVDDS